MSIVQVLSNDQLDEQARKEAALKQPVPTLVTELASYVRTCWDRAYTAKTNVTATLLQNMRQFNSEYDPEKLGEIRKLQGSEIFIELTATKCNAAFAWLADVMIQPNQKDRPWDIRPTPLPDLPDEIRQQIMRSVYNEVSTILAQARGLMGNDPASFIQDLTPEIEDRIKKKLEDRAKMAVERLKVKMDDQMIEGGWYEALGKCLFDLVVYKTSFLKGPIYRKVKTFKRRVDPSTGKFQNVFSEEVKPFWERRSPFDIYPSPDSTSPDDGYIIDKFSLTLKDLNGLIGLEGFDEAAIRRVLQRYKDGTGHREWATLDTQIKQQQTANAVTTIMDTDKIDTIEFWGNVQGSYLLDWGMTTEDIPDPDLQYDVCVWLIDNEVIKAMVNPNPMGLRPLSAGSYLELPDTIWGKGLPELIKDLQTLCNAFARAMANNAAIASGPLVEVNVERVENYDGVLYPWKQIKSTDIQMSGAPAVRFYQPSVITGELLRLFDYFSKLADQYSIPAYAHGDTSVGGAGDTASGLSMLMNSANKIIKNVIKNVDKMIADSVYKLYFYDILYEEDVNMIGDVNVVATGSASILMREQQVVRRNEFLANTNNPTDLQILGLDGRRELLVEVARSLELPNIDKILPEIDGLEKLKLQIQQQQQQMQQQQPPPIKGAPPAAGPQNVGMMGEAPQGQDIRQSQGMGQSSVPQ